MPVYWLACVRFLAQAQVFHCLFMSQSWASYLILHANSPKIINGRIYFLGQQINSTVHCIGKICWNPQRILVIQLLPRLTIASDYWTTSQCTTWKKYSLHFLCFLDSKLKHLNSKLKGIDWKFSFGVSRMGYQVESRHLSFEWMST